MKLFLILIFSFSFSIAAFAQADSLGFTNKAEAENKTVNGSKEGKWCEYIRYVDGVQIIDSANGHYYQLTIYKAGKPYGIQRGFATNGSLSFIGQYDSNGRKNGVWRDYYDNRKLDLEIKYINGEQSGEEKDYDENGFIKSETYFDTLKNKVTKFYGTPGDYKECGYGEFFFKAIRYPDGTEKQYYANGVLKAEYHFDGSGYWLSDGTYKEYYKSGNLKTEFTYKNNKIVRELNYDDFGNEIK